MRTTYAAQMARASVLTRWGRLRNVARMLQPAFIRRGLGWLGLLLVWGAAMLPHPAQAAAKPYVEKAPKRGFHLFLHAKQKTPTAQWDYVQDLARAGKAKAAAKQALALRIYWPNAPEAPQAQMFYARHLDRRQNIQDAFDAYQHLVDHYPGRFEFDELISRQMQLAKTLMTLKKGHFLFIPGFAAPERAIPLFEKIVATAPESPLAAEAFYCLGVANERTYEYEKAIDAYFTVLNRFPESAFAEDAAYSQAQCHIMLAQESPNDNRALETASAACTLFLQRFPDSARRTEIIASQARLQRLQADNAYARARYYDRILHKPEAALIAYRHFLALYPQAEQAAEAKQRVAQLSPTTPPPEN